MSPLIFCAFFFFNDTATTEIYTLSLHDALPIYARNVAGIKDASSTEFEPTAKNPVIATMAEQREIVSGEGDLRSEEHTSELQSRQYLVCRLLLEINQQLVEGLLLADADHGAGVG